MKTIYFEEVNVEIAKDQPEFQTIPAHVTKEGVMVTCFELDPREIENIIKHKRLWVHVMIGNGQLQPFNIFAVKNYFDSVRTDGLNIIVNDEEDVNSELEHLINPFKKKNEYLEFETETDREDIKTGDWLTVSDKKKSVRGRVVEYNIRSGYLKLDVTPE